MVAVAPLYGIVAARGNQDKKYLGLEWDASKFDQPGNEKFRPALESIQSFLYAGFNQSTATDEEKAKLEAALIEWTRSPGFNKQDLERIKNHCKGLSLPEFASRAVNIIESLDNAQDIASAQQPGALQAPPALADYSTYVQPSQPAASAAPGPQPGPKVDVPKKDDSPKTKTRYLTLDRRGLIESVGFKFRMAGTGPGGQNFVKYAPGLGEKGLGGGLLAPNEPGKTNVIYHEVGKVGSGPYFGTANFVFKGGVPVNIGAYGSGPIQQVSSVATEVTYGGASQDFSYNRAGILVSVPKKGFAFEGIANTKKGTPFKWNVKLFGGEFGGGTGNFHCEQLGERSCPKNSFELMAFNVREQLNVGFAWRTKGGLPIGMSFGIGVFSTNFYAKNKIFDELEFPNLNVWPVQFSFGMMFGGKVADRADRSEALFKENKGVPDETSRTVADIVVTTISSDKLGKENQSGGEELRYGNAPIQPETLTSLTSLRAFNGLLMGFGYGLITGLPTVLYEGKTAEKITVGMAYGAAMATSVGKWVLHRNDEANGYAGRLETYQFGLLGTLTLSDYGLMKSGSLNAMIKRESSFKAKVPWILLGGQAAAGIVLSLYGFIGNGVDPIVATEPGEPNPDRDQLKNDPESTRFGLRYSFLHDAMIVGGVGLLGNAIFKGIDWVQRRSAFKDGAIPGGTEVNLKDQKQRIKGGVTLTNPPPVNGQRAEGFMIRGVLQF